MGKRIIQQARGHGSPTYRVRVNAYKIRLGFPRTLDNSGKVIKLLNSRAHSAPIAKIKMDSGIFFIPAFKGMIEGQKIDFGDNNNHEGNIMPVRDISPKTPIYCIEAKPGDGGKFMKTAGSSARISKVIGDDVYIIFPSKKEKKLNPNCRAVIGVIAGAGRLDKPIVKAGKKHYMQKARNKLWPRTSAIKVNAIDHPFGSGRGKNPKSKIAKRNAPPGAKVGHIRPKRTGRRR